MPDRVASILADYAIEVRKLAYILPSGIGETEALRLSEAMAHDADVWLRRSPARPAATSRPSTRMSHTPQRPRIIPARVRHSDYP